MNLLNKVPKHRPDDGRLLSIDIVGPSFNTVHIRITNKLNRDYYYLFLFKP